MSAEGYFEIDFETESQESIAPAIEEIWKTIGRVKWGIFRKNAKRAKTLKRTTDILSISTIEERVRRAASASLYTENPNFYEKI